MMSCAPMTRLPAPLDVSSTGMGRVIVQRMHFAFAVEDCLRYTTVAATIRVG